MNKQLRKVPASFDEPDGTPDTATSNPSDVTAAPSAAPHERRRARETTHPVAGGGPGPRSLTGWAHAEPSRRRNEPYLLQHADNPVDWWEWSDAAFEEAARRDVPVLLSVGYAACHWCHVMAHESFEDAATAEQINAGFVAVKVDREERPDIDAVYMAATQAMTGQGGWPMTCFLTPAGEPFHCGTYYPTAHFRRLLAAVTQAWTDDGARVRSSAGQIAARLADNAAARLPPAGLDAEALEAAVQELVGEFDARERRVRGRAEVPAVDDAGVPAAPPRAHRFGARRCTSRRRRRGGWPAAACTTSSRAVSPATAWTRAGSSRTSRRCSTTTRCCCGSTPTSPASRARMRPSPGGWRRRPRSSCCGTCARPRAGSPRRWTPTRTASRA